MKNVLPKLIFQPRITRINTNRKRVSIGVNSLFHLILKSKSSQLKRIGTNHKEIIISEIRVNSWLKFILLYQTDVKRYAIQLNDFLSTNLFEYDFCFKAFSWLRLQIAATIIE
jgi:hypothetical protein